jgi:hypothetical protein
MKQPIVIVGVCVGWVLFLLSNSFFISTSLYWFDWWPDVLMHIWGGVLIVATWYTIFRNEVFPRALRLPLLHPLLVLLATVVGWEIFEYVIGRSGPPYFWFDTSLDLLFGLGGGLVVFLLCRSRTIKK